ncbi:adenylate/guanylate cyclase domain-containing protein [Conexibacter sp. DBS9H8]|uniref:adenylate/guanylate cyclase domain-containing protein n=1 Tax=Conexibacter sp. DBS9H8 TaxID=2937801 RepID=UPI002010B5A2|nr:adenylate/guanylate cyclase domain-containing protein [Conexibacter sp. DBS9H8]
MAGDPPLRPISAHPGGSRRLLSRLRGAFAGLDRQPALLLTVRRLRRRLPGDPEFGDAFSTAGAPTLAYLVESVATLTPEPDSVVAEVGLAGLQLWQSLAEATGRGRGEREMALLYADIVDSSSLALRVGDEVTVEVLRAVANTVQACVEAHQGRIVRRLGDGIIASFSTAESAVAAALDIQDAVLFVEVDGTRVRLRIGVHWGRPRRLRGDYVGVDVSVVAAVGAAARPGQVLVSTPALLQIDPAAHGLRFGRRKRLRSPEAPASLQIAVARRG